MRRGDPETTNGKSAQQQLVTDRAAHPVRLTETFVMCIQIPHTAYIRAFSTCERIDSMPSTNKKGAFRNQATFGRSLVNQTL